GGVVRRRGRCTVAFGRWAEPEPTLVTAGQRVGERTAPLRDLERDLPEPPVAERVPGVAFEVVAEHLAGLLPLAGAVEQVGQRHRPPWMVGADQPNRLLPGGRGLDQFTVTFVLQRTLPQLPGPVARAGGRPPVEPPPAVVVPVLPRLIPSLKRVPEP